MTTVKSVQHVIKHNCTHLKLYFRVRITVGMIQNGNIEIKPPETGPATEPGTGPFNRYSYFEPEKYFISYLNGNLMNW